MSGVIILMEYQSYYLMQRLGMDRKRCSYQLIQPMLLSRARLVGELRE